MSACREIAVCTLIVRLVEFNPNHSNPVLCLDFDRNWISIVIEHSHTQVPFPAVGDIREIERFCMTFTANGKRKIPVYVSSK